MDRQRRVFRGESFRTAQCQGSADAKIWNGGGRSWRRQRMNNYIEMCY